MHLARHDTKIFGFVLSVVCLIIYTYSPIFFHEFAYHNDYRIWDYNGREVFFGYPETRHLIGIGRPVLAILLNVHLMFINNMQGLHIAQIVAVISIAILAGIYFFYLQKALNISKAGATLLALLTFTLPSMAINSFWITNYTSEVIPLFIAFGAYALVQKYFISRNYKWLILGAAFFLLYLDLLIYPPATFFFVTLMFIKLLFGPKHVAQEKLSNVFFEIILILLVAVVYFLSIKCCKHYFLQHPFFLHTYLGGYNWQEYYKIVDASFPQYKLTLGGSLLGKWQQVKELICFVCAAWFSPLKLRYILLILCFFVGIIFWSAVANRPQNSLNPLRLNALLQVFLLSIIALLTAGPFLASPSAYLVNYRVIFASAALVPAIIVFIFEKVTSSKRNQLLNLLIMTSILLFILIAEIIAKHRLTLVVERAVGEYRLVQTALAQEMSDDIKEIRIQLPVVDKPNASYLLADFGLNASDIGIAGLVKAGLQSINKSHRAYKIVFAKEFPPDLNQEAILIRKISLPHKKMISSEIIGKWFVNGKTASIKVNEDGLILTNEFKISSPGVISRDQSFLTAAAWNNLKCSLSVDGRELRWSNDTAWQR